MSVVVKCDRCGKLMEDGIKKGGTVRYCGGARFDPLSATELELCEECYTEFLEFLKGNESGHAQ